MSSQPLVSTVIATYNMARYLHLAVRSVLEQTHRNIELHVVDDGSTDDTREVMKQFSANPRVNYHFQKNQGQARAKNTGILHSTGEFIAFLDADDIWMPEKLQKQLVLFDRSHKVGVVYSRGLTIDENGRVFSSSQPVFDKGVHSGRITAPLLVENFVGFNTVVVRKECFTKLGLFDESFPMAIDYDLWLRFSTQYEFDYLDEPTIYYRVWQGQMSKDWQTRYRCAIKIMQNFLEKYPDLVPTHMIKKAWAHTYVGRGWCWAYLKKSRVNALKDYVRALKFSPAYVPAWKEIASLCLKRL